MIFKLRKLVKGDIKALYHLQPEGWQDIVYYFDYYVQNPSCYPFCAEANGMIIGVGNAICNGYTGWLSHIIVEKGSRRMGVGKAITNRLIEFLLDKGSKTLLLIATAEGGHLYRKLGFKTDLFYSCFRGRIEGELISDKVKILKNQRIDEILEIDRYITNEDRSKFIEPFLTDVRVYISEKCKIEGFYVPALGEGPVIAKNLQAGLELLKLKHLVQEKKSTIPETNSMTIKFFEEKGCIEYNQIERMYFGEHLEWHSSLIFSRIGGFIG